MRFTAANALGTQAASVAPAPFHYDVTLVLDSRTYRGTATWPGNEDPECSPCARIHFSPRLPAL